MFEYPTINVHNFIYHISDITVWQFNICIFHYKFDSSACELTYMYPRYTVDSAVQTMHRSNAVVWPVRLD